MKRGLGKGLDSLLSSSFVNRSKQVSHDKHAEEAQQKSDDYKGSLQNIDTYLLHPGKYQPRRNISTDALQELADSIHSQGIIQPIVIRATGHQNYEIIAGERRWRAAKIVGLKTIPCIVNNVEDNVAVAIALIENMQRENLNAMEEAMGLKRLVEEFELTHVEVAKVVGKSRSAISNLLRLNNLIEAVQKQLEAGLIEMGHARSLLALPSEKQTDVAAIVIAKQLSVRETEKLVKNTLSGDLNTDDLENKLDPIKETTLRLTQLLGTKVQLSQSKNGKGKLVISFDDQEKLDEILDFLNK